MHDLVRVTAVERTLGSESELALALLAAVISEY